MARHARVMLHAKVNEGDVENFERAFEVVAVRMAGAEGFIQDELLRGPQTDVPSYIIFSEWVSADAFWTWFHNPSHHDTTAPMSPFWYDAHIEIVDLVYRLPVYAPPSAAGGSP